MDYGLETLVNLNSNLKYPKTLLKVLVKGRLSASSDLIEVPCTLKDRRISPWHDCPIRQIIGGRAATEQDTLRRDPPRLH